MPVVSIGMPVYNGEAYMRTALDALLSQTFSDFELIISDNHSTDETENICLEFAAKDKRIKYIRQSLNIGATENFKFVFDASNCEYFMWAACDDIRANDFIEVNLLFLKDNSDYVGSTSPNGFEGVELSEQKFINFKLDGDMFERFTEFFKNGWVSHGIFYSLIRTSALRECPVLGKSFIGADWAINLYLATKGKINRTESSYIIFGVDGVSSSSNAFKAFRNKYIELIIPLYELSKYVLSISKCFNLKQRIKITLILIKLNLQAEFHQAWAWPYSIYFKHIRPIIRHKTLTK